MLITSQSNKNLLENISIYKLAVESSLDHIIITDPNGKILYANKSAEYMTGYSFSEMKGKTPGLWGKLMDKSFYQNLWKTIKQEKTHFHGEIRNKRKNGEEYYSIVIISPILDKNKDILGFIGTEEDITEFKLLDKRKAEFLSIASHQLRTPLGSMRWNMEMLLEEEYGKLEKQTKDVIKQIYDSNLRMITLVNDLLSVSRIEQGRVFDEPKETDVEEVIKSVAAEIEVEAQKKAIIGELQFGKEKLPKVIIDPKRLREVLKNLISNAIKYNKKNGKVTVKVKKEKDHLCFEITDIGIGIPKNDQKKIFSKFFRAENAAVSVNEGSGLGLFIVQSYLEGWGGKVWFKSIVGKGTTFIFTLPLIPKKSKVDKNNR